MQKKKKKKKKKSDLSASSKGVSRTAFFSGEVPWVFLADRGYTTMAVFEEIFRKLITDSFKVDEKI